LRVPGEYAYGIRTKHNGCSRDMAYQCASHIFTFDFATRGHLGSAAAMRTENQPRLPPLIFAVLKSNLPVASMNASDPRRARCSSCHVTRCGKSAATAHPQCPVTSHGVASWSW
jgi:hypothetical protein